MEDSVHPRGRTVRSGLLTGLSTGLVSLSAAGAGIVLSRKFGHGVKTDGFFAAYAVYLALVLVATALRVVVLPGFVRARRDGRLGGEVTTWLGALALPLVPVLVVCVGWPDLVARALTADPDARHAAAARPRRHTPVFRLCRPRRPAVRSLELFRRCPCSSRSNQ